MLFKSKNVKVFFVLFVLCLLFAAPAQAKMNLAFAHVLAPEHPYQAACEKMKEIVEARTNGEITITIHPSASLAEEPGAIEALNGDNCPHYSVRSTSNRFCQRVYGMRFTVPF